MRLLITTLLLVLVATPALADKQMDCLALNIYHEARSESVDGQRAVGLVTLERVFSKKHPNTICEVVYKPFAFSWTIDNPPVEEPKAYLKARQIAREVLLIKTFGLDTLQAEFYHHENTNPSWASSFQFVKQIGPHKFYRR